MSLVIAPTVSLQLQTQIHELLQQNPEFLKQDICVVSSFEDAEFKEYFESESFIISASLLLESLQQNIPIPFLTKERRAVFNTALTGIVICTSNLNQLERDKLCEIAIFMGARITHNYTSTVTHLITNTTNTQKYKLAKSRDDMILKPEWLYDCWKTKTLITPNIKHKLEEPKPILSKPIEEDNDHHLFHVNNKKNQIKEEKTEENNNFLHHREDSSPEIINDEIMMDVNHDNNVPPLHDCIISVSGYSTQQRHVIKQIIIMLGGKYSLSLNNQITHFMCENPNRKKFQEAKLLKIPYLISGKWLEECSKQRIHVDESFYLLAPKNNQNKQQNNPAELQNSNHNAFIWHESICARFNKEAINPGLLFDGICFSTIEFDIDEVSDLCEVIKNYGGSFSSDLSGLEIHCSFLIAPHGFTSPDDNNEKLSSFFIISPNWIERCIEEGKLLHPQSHVLFTPLPCSVPLKESKGKTISISGITSRERRSLRMLLIVLGFTYSETLTKTVDYLLTNSPIIPSNKCKIANEWNIPLIHVKWILQSATIGSLLPLSSFYLFPNLPQPKSIQTTTNHSNSSSKSSKSAFHSIHSSSPSSKFFQSNNDNNNSSQSPMFMNKIRPILVGAIIFISNRVCPQVKEKIQEMASMLGASVQSKLSNSITHVIDTNFSSSKSKNSNANENTTNELYSPSTMKIKYPSIQIVSPTWIIDSFKLGKWANEINYPSNIHPNMKLIKNQSKNLSNRFQINQNSKNSSTLGKRRKLQFSDSIINQLNLISPNHLPPPRKKQKLSMGTAAKLFNQHNQEEEKIMAQSSDSFDDNHDSIQPISNNNQNDDYFSRLPSFGESIMEDVEKYDHVQELNQKQSETESENINSSSTISDDDFNNNNSELHTTLESNDISSIISEEKFKKLTEKQNEIKLRAQTEQETMNIHDDNMNATNIANNDPLPIPSSLHDDNNDDKMECDNVNNDNDIKLDEIHYSNDEIEQNENNLSDYENNSSDVEGDNSEFSEISENAQVLEELEKLLQQFRPQQIENHTEQINNQIKQNISPQISLSKSTNRITMSELYDDNHQKQNKNQNNNHDDSDDEFEFGCLDDESQEDSQVVIYKDPIQKISSNDEHEISTNSNEISIESVCNAFASQIQVPKKYFLISSSFDNQLKSKLSDIVIQLGGFILDSSIHSMDKMTHLIVKGSSRSLKYLSALAAGCWILSADFLLSSHENNAWVSEIDFECDFSTKDQPISPPQYWRSKISENGSFGKSFWGIKVALFIKRYEDDVSQVLKLGGAQIMYCSSSNSMLDPSYLNYITLAIVDESLLTDKSTLASLKLLQKNSIRCISAKFISDSLCKLPCKSMKGYTITLKKRSSQRSPKK